MDVVGIAPFFADIDFTRNGEVTVSESTAPEVLLRANQVINENLEQGDFSATSVVIVSYMNVSAPNEKSSNTYQTILIGGTDSRKQSMTFAEFLYDQIIWSANAEAGIMTRDKLNSIQLPGSGTQGIEQLSELSNIQKPGIWLYRVDRSVVDPCIQNQLQPPYCDDQSPTLVTRKFQQTSTSHIVPPKAQNLPKDESFEQTIIPEPIQPQTIQPSLIEVPINPDELIDDSFSFHSKENDLTTQTTTRRPTETTTIRRRVSPAFPTVQTERVTESSRPSTSQRIVESTSHQPIVAIKSTEFNEIPPDAFETTSLSPFITVIPQVFKQEDMQEKTIQEKPTQETILSTTIAKNSKETTSFINESPTIGRVISSHEFNPHNFPQPPGNEEKKMEISNRIAILETTNTPEIIDSTQNLASSTKNIIHAASSENTANLVFSTLRPTSPKKVLQSKNHKLITGTAPPTTKKPVDDDPSSVPFDDNRVLDAEMSSSRLAILIPVTIVAVWLLILIVIAVVLCCQRR